MKVRRFKGGAVNHVYQRTQNRFNIFYDLADYLVYFTMFCTFARQAGVVVWGLCLMIDHIHALIQTENLKDLSDFMSRVTSVYARAYNKVRGRKGSLFEERFGSAPKSDIKKLLSSIIYVGNNPVERRMCSRAEDYRWNFISYMVSEHPFSEKLLLRNASASLARAVSVVNLYRSRDLYLDYGVLDSLLGRLKENEREQLADYIIWKYNVIDKTAVFSHFDSYEQMLVSMRSTTGSEYDLKEHKDRFSDAVYSDLISWFNDMGVKNIRNVVTMSVDEKVRWAAMFRESTDVPMIQICKFLHLII